LSFVMKQSLRASMNTTKLKAKVLGSRLIGSVEGSIIAGK